MKFSFFNFNKYLNKIRMCFYFIILTVDQICGRLRRCAGSRNARTSVLLISMSTDFEIRALIIGLCCCIRQNQKQITNIHFKIEEP
jgi:hypothetical protein